MPLTQTQQRQKRPARELQTLPAASLGRSGARLAMADSQIRGQISISNLINPKTTMWSARWPWQPVDLFHLRNATLLHPSSHSAPCMVLRLDHSLTHVLLGKPMPRGGRHPRCSWRAEWTTYPSRWPSRSNRTLSSPGRRPILITVDIIHVCFTIVSIDETAVNKRL